jgi:hypothetical protein
MKDIARRLAMEADAAARIAAGDEKGEIGVEKPQDIAPLDTSMTDMSPTLKDAGAWLAVDDMDNHVGATKVTIIDDTTMRIDYIRTMTNEIFDTVTLKRDHSAGKFPQA